MSTILELVPSEQLAVAVLANAVSDLPQRVLEKVYTVLLPGYVAAPHPAPDLAKDEVRFEPTPELRGTWSGLVSTHAAELPLELTFHADGEVHARLGSQLTTLLNQVRLTDGWLTGRMLGDVGTVDANRRPYLLHADLKRRGEVLNGALIAISPPEIRFGNALSYWTELRKVAKPP